MSSYGIVLALVSKIDGLNFLLFHVEQQKPYEYRWRIAREAEEWQVGISESGAATRVFPGEAGCTVEVQWRGFSVKQSKGRGQWRQAALHEFLAGVAEFLVFIPPNTDFDTSLEHTFIAPSRFVEGVSSFAVSANSKWTPVGDGYFQVKALATNSLPANHLVSPDDFCAEQAGIVVKNITPTMGSLVLVTGAANLSSVDSPSVSYAAITKKPKSVPAPLIPELT